MMRPARLKNQEAERSPGILPICPTAMAIRPQKKYLRTERSCHISSARRVHNKNDSGRNRKVFEHVQIRAFGALNPIRQIHQNVGTWIIEGS